MTNDDGRTATVSPLMSRREFTGLVAASAVTALGARHSVMAADDTLSRPMLGFSLYGMRRLPIADALRTCADIGYECVELAVMVDWPCAPEMLSTEQRRELKQHLA